MPLVIARADHSISRQDICPNALKVLYRLKGAGFRACLVGGGVRDLLVGLKPKDFDIATDATPEQVKDLFRNARLIGRRFRLAHVHFGRRDYIEVATFRGASGQGEQAVADSGRVLYDNVYGTIDEDAVRRDFTINALYYDIDGFSVIDYCGGYEDIKAGVIRLIGDPIERYREDPVRLIRAVRFAAKLGFSVEEATERPVFELGQLLHDIPPARLFEEVLKLFLSGHGAKCLELLRHYGLFGHLFPDTDRALQADANEGGQAWEMLRQALINTDQRIVEEKPVTPAFLFAALLWAPLRRQVRELEQNHALHDALHLAAERVTLRQLSRTAIPRRFSTPMREIWAMQPRFQRRQGKRAKRLLGHPRFRAAYDFLLLRVSEDESLREAADWWTSAQGDPAQPTTASADAPRKKRRRRRRKPAGDAPSTAS